MTNHSNYFAKTMLVATCLAVGCTGGQTTGCGSSDRDENGSERPASELPGVYAVDSYRGSPIDPETKEPLVDSCDDLSDAPRHGDFIVLYSFRPSTDSDEAGLAGVFCDDVASCKEVTKTAPEPSLGYSFTQDDEGTWTGYGISRTGAAAGDQCSADVQIHTLRASGDGIQITTDTVETVFPPMSAGEQVTCRNGDALDQLSPDLPCKSRLALEATRTSE